MARGAGGERQRAGAHRVRAVREARERPPPPTRERAAPSPRRPLCQRTPQCHGRPTDHRTPPVRSNNRAFELFEENISDSKAQVAALQLIVGSLRRCPVFGAENREALVHKATGYRRARAPTHATRASAQTRASAYTRAGAQLSERSGGTRLLQARRSARAQARTRSAPALL